MKKWMAGALALAMVLAMALTGCGGSASSGAVSGSAAASGADQCIKRTGKRSRDYDFLPYRTRRDVDQ